MAAESAHATQQWLRVPANRWNLGLLLQNCHSSAREPDDEVPCNNVQGEEPVAVRYCAGLFEAIQKRMVAVSVRRTEIGALPLTQLPLCGGGASRDSR